MSYPEQIAKVPRTIDPLERMIETALIDAGIRYQAEIGGCTSHNLDFHLPDFDLAIEVKRFHSPRIAEQMSRHPNVIAVQGMDAVQLFSRMIRHGGLMKLNQKENDA